MAFIAVSGELGCRHEELAQMAAERLQCKLITEADLERRIAAQFGQLIPDKAWRPLAATVLAGAGLEQHLLFCCLGAEILAQDLPAAYRFHLVAPEAIRLENVAADCRLSRADAKTRLRKMAAVQSLNRKRRFGQKMSQITNFDVIVNTRSMAPADLLNLLESVVRSRGLLEPNLPSAQDVEEVQSQARLQLARHGVARYATVPPDSARRDRKPFCHPSEEVFASLLDFYRVVWDYEPRSFPLQWDKDGKVSEAFTPDFYLPEFDLYLELTTMKQANVTRKNRKIRLLRAIYPHVNIQVFYQKDVQDLVMKYRAPERISR